MSFIKKSLSLLFTAITIISCFTLPASAKNVCKEISGKSSRLGGVSTTFYVQTANKKKHSVTMKMTKGKLRSEDALSCGITGVGKNIYDYYEVLVFGKKSNGEYVQISKANVKNKSSYKISFEGYTNYKIKIWSWKTATINRVGKYYVHPLDKNIIYSAEWMNNQIPTWNIKRTSGVTFCK